MISMYHLLTCPSVISCMTPHPVTGYRHRVDLSLCYSLMWNLTLEYTATVAFQEGWPLVRGKNQYILFRYTLSSGRSRGGGLSSGWPLKRGSTVLILLSLVRPNREILPRPSTHTSEH